MGKKIFLTENQLKYVIKESLTDVVFHFTTVRNLYNIVSNNKILLSSSFDLSTDSYMSSMYPYYLSLTRTFNSKFGYVGYKNSLPNDSKRSVNISNALNVRIEFNGKMLNNNFKGAPVNYHWRENSANKQQQAMKSMWGDKWDDVKDMQLVTIRQDEDRLLSKKPIIDNVSVYVSRIDITLDVNGFSNNLEPSYINMLYKIISNENFVGKIFIYNNENDYNKYHSNAFVNDKIINAFKNLHGLFDNSDSINNRSDFFNKFGRGHSDNEVSVGSEISDSKIIQIGAIMKYLYIIDNTINVNNYFNMIADELLKSPCPFTKEEIIEKLNKVFNNNFTKDEIQKKVRTLKDNFRGNLRCIYTFITDIMSNVFRKYVSEHKEEVFTWLNNNKKIDVKAPTFGNMASYFFGIK